VVIGIKIIRKLDGKLATVMDKSKVKVLISQPAPSLMAAAIVVISDSDEEEHGKGRSMQAINVDDEDDLLGFFAFPYAKKSILKKQTMTANNIVITFFAFICLFFRNGNYRRFL
jgi:hypothetical protein